MKWNEISRESYFHALHFKQGLKSKHNKLCDLLSSHAVENMTEPQKEWVLKNMIRDNLESKCPLDVIESIIELEKTEWLSECNLTPEDFIGE